MGKPHHPLSLDRSASKFEKMMGGGTPLGTPLLLSTAELVWQW